MQVIHDLFSQDQLDYLLALPAIQSAYIKGTNHNFSVDVGSDIQTTLNSKLGLHLSTTIPCRLIVGDTPAHSDRGPTDFEHTYLVYLNDSEGDFIIDGQSYAITANTAFKFAEGLNHEVVATNGSKRLLLGPMNEHGQYVGGPTHIPADGETDTIYFSYISSGPSTGLFYRINNGLLQGPSLPITIINTNTSYTLKVIFETDIIVSSPALYFICGSDNIQFGSTSLNSDGSRPTIIIDDVSNYPGLIKNYDGTNGFNTIRICNLQMTGTGSPSLDAGNGWFGQAGFGTAATGNLIVNCSTDNTLPISTLSGGIVGGGAGAGSGARLEIIGCTTAGTISGLAGGIVGQYAGQNSGRILVSQCSSSGAISSGGGGIFGKYAGISSGIANAYNCYSTGTIYSGGGGIYGEYAGDGSGGPDATETVATNCYSTGYIDTNSGGIFGQNAAIVATASYCFSTGEIFGGGIFGANYLGTATNCYTCGVSSATPTSGIYAGSGVDGANNYSEANNGGSSWNIDNAASAGIVPGSIWLSVISNQPFIFTTIGFTPYQLNNITLDASGNVFYTDFASTVTAGEVTAPAILPLGGTYDLINSPSPNITINATTGAISAAANTAASTYTLTIRFTINPYSVTTYTLTVEEAQAIAATSAPCCGTLAGQSNLVYNTINDVQAGNTFASSLSNPKFRFASYTDYLKYQISKAYRR